MSLPNRLAGGIALTCQMFLSFQTLMAENRSADETSGFLVRVDNVAAVPPEHVRFAEDRAAAVFGRIGATIRWIDEDDAARDRVKALLTVVIVNGEQSQGGASRFVDALGLANPSVRRAHVFYDRVAALNVGTPRTIPSLLGDVIAHELGHLLLPPPGHSLDGIMRAELETRSWALKTFTAPQAREVLTRLRGLRSAEQSLVPLPPSSTSRLP
jgi:hypothetical protein